MTAAEDGIFNHSGREGWTHDYRRETLRKQTDIKYLARKVFLTKDCSLVLFFHTIFFTHREISNLRLWTIETGRQAWQASQESRQSTALNIVLGRRIRVGESGRALERETLCPSTLYSVTVRVIKSNYFGNGWMGVGGRNCWNKVVMA